MDSILEMTQSAPPADAARMKSMLKEWILSDTVRDFVVQRPLSSLTMARDLIDDAGVTRRGELIGHYSFPSMDRVVHLGKGFGFGLSMCSTRIANFESINDNNLHGWFTGDGMTMLYNADLTAFTDAYAPTGSLGSASASFEAVEPLNASGHCRTDRFLVVVIPSDPVLLVWQNAQISPGTAGIPAVIDILVIAVVGGISRPIGPFIGALIYVLLRTFSPDVLTAFGMSGERFKLLIGFGFLAIVFFSPDGVLGLWERWKDRRRKAHDPLTGGGE